MNDEAHLPLPLDRRVDAGTGQVLWYFDTTTDNLWGQPTVNSGGGFWHPPSVDDDGKLYIGVANPAPYPGVKDWPWASSRPGDNCKSR